MIDAEPTVFIIDDDPSARESLAALAHAHGVHAEVFASAEEFLTRYDANRPGCIVVDYRMEGMSGLDLQHEVAIRGGLPPMILITAYADVPLAVRAMQAGAITVLEKPAGGHDLWQAIQQAIAIDSSRRQQQLQLAEVRGRFAALREEERQIVDLIVAGQPNKAIASKLGIGLRTVELRRAGIMEKLHVQSALELTRLVVFAQGKSTILAPPAVSRME